MMVRVVLIILLTYNLGECARILGVFPVASPSHYILGNALMRGLAEAGHDVTIISPYSDKEPPKTGSWREIVLDGFIEDVNKKFSKPVSFHKKTSNPLSFFFILNKAGRGEVEKTLRHPKVQSLIRSEEKFDVVILLQSINDALKAFANHFNAHLILFTRTTTNSLVNPLVGNPALPSHFPELMIGYSGHMSFFQRLLNTIYKFLTVLTVNGLYYPGQNKLIQKYFPDPVHINDILYNVSLVLVNSHVSLTDVQPTVPCMIDIGGFHIKPPKKLPDDLQAFLDNAREGVIYFSLGSNLKSKNLPAEKRDAILKAFGKRKEKVLWKWEEDVLPGQPANVKLGKWFPQQDILAHPNVKLFLTHGGMLSTIETVYHGVPIIVIPIFGDQIMNANSAQEAGYGRVLPFDELSEETLSELLEEVIRNPKYRENVKRRSIIMQDRQVKPLDNAIYWIEYVIRHNGAKHLRVPYLDLTWYQYYLLDVLGFILLVILATCLVIRKTYCYFYKRRGNRGKQKIH